MANPHRGGVSLRVGDRDYTLSFSVNALCELEDEIDKPVSEIVAEIQNLEKVRMKSVRSLIWASLRDHHGDISMAEAGQIATDAGMQACMEKVGEAFRFAFPQAPKAGGKANPPKAAAG